MAEKSNQEMFAMITSQMDCQRALSTALFASLTPTERTLCTKRTTDQLKEMLLARDRTDVVSLAAMTNAIDRLMGELKRAHDAAMPPKTH